MLRYCCAAHMHLGKLNCVFIPPLALRGTTVKAVLRETDTCSACQVGFRQLLSLTPLPESMPVSGLEPGSSGSGD